MLKELHIENIAVIENLTVSFIDGLIALTGETGAGKSIIIDSLNMVLGERANKELIRTGKSTAYVSAYFDNINQSVLKIIEEYGFTADNGTIIVSRQMSLDGKSTSKINERPVTAGALKEIGKLLVNIHGQHDSQALLIPEKHIDFVDSFGKCEKELADYRRIYAQISDVRNQIKSISTDVTEKERKMQLLKYQIDEIDEAKLIPDEEDQLSQRKAIIQNSEKYLKAVDNAYGCLYNEEEGGAKALLDTAVGDLARITSISPQIESMHTQLLNVTYLLGDIIDSLRVLIEDTNYDENEIDSIESRLDTIYKLKKKYGHDVNEVLRYCDKCKEEYNGFEQSDDKLEQLKLRYDELLIKLKEQAQALTKKRQKAAKELEDKIVAELSYMDMPKVKFVVSITPCIYNHNGGDNLEFLISANAGEEPKPLSKIASGGELSRIMLAMKSIFTNQDIVDTLIFDEIDTGVSGSAAQKIGYKMQSIAKSKQVICITHLSQIAALAKSHYKIEKHTDKGKTFTRVELLDFNGRVNELARIISGVNVTNAALETAKEMLLNETER